MDLDDFLRCKHLVTSLTGDLQGIVDEELKDNGLSREIVAGVSSFIAPPAIITGSNYLLTCLDAIASKAVENYQDLKVYACPVEMPEINICQIWHQRTHQDPLRKWLRQQIRHCLAG